MAPASIDCFRKLQSIFPSGDPDFGWAVQNGSISMKEVSRNVLMNFGVVGQQCFGVFKHVLVSADPVFCPTFFFVPSQLSRKWWY